MKYAIDPVVFSSSFSFPSSVVDDNIKIATETEIKTVLYFFRHFAEGVNIGNCANELGITENEVSAALNFWKKAGVITSEDSDAADSINTTKTAVVKNEKPSRHDVAKRGAEDSNFAMLLNEAQLKFGRSLKTNEASTFLRIYEDLGLDLSVCLYLLQYAVKTNIFYIEKTAVKWVNAGVKTINDAEKTVIKEINENLAWKRCEKAFGIEHRKPSAKEKQLCMKWFDEWHIDDDVLALAYDVCVDSKSKFIFSYCAKIIDNWYNSGLTTRKDIEKHLADKKTVADRTDSYAGYDMDMFEMMINSEDREGNL